MNILVYELGTPPMHLECPQPDRQVYPRSQHCWRILWPFLAPPADLDPGERLPVSWHMFVRPSACPRRAWTWLRVRRRLRIGRWGQVGAWNGCWWRMPSWRPRIDPPARPGKGINECTQWGMHENQGDIEILVIPLDIVRIGFCCLPLIHGMEVESWIVGLEGLKKALRASWKLRSVSGQRCERRGMWCVPTAPRHTQLKDGAEKGKKNETETPPLTDGRTVWVKQMSMTARLGEVVCKLWGNVSRTSQHSFSSAGVERFGGHP